MQTTSCLSMGQGEQLTILIWYGLGYTNQKVATFSQADPYFLLLTPPPPLFNAARSVGDFFYPSYTCCQKQGPSPGSVFEKYPEINCFSLKSLAIPKI